MSGPSRGRAARSSWWIWVPAPPRGPREKSPGSWIRSYVVARIGATADSVSKVVITHMHWDHVGNIAGYLRAFPKAKFYVQKREFDFCVKNPVCQRKPVVVVFDPTASKIVGDLERSGRLVIVDGDVNLAPGIDLLLAPGHTLGLQVVRVNTAKGPAIVGSDCAHVFRGYREDNPSVFIMDMPAWIQSFDKVKSKAAIDLIFPGHDILMSENFPKVAPGCHAIGLGQGQEIGAAQPIRRGPTGTRPPSEFD